MFVKLRGYRYNDNVVWLDASTNCNLLTHIRELCRLFGLSTADHANGRTVMDGVSMMKQVYKYFTNSKVLFVFQNAMSFQQINEFLPPVSLNPNAHVVITATQRFCVRRFRHISLGRFSLANADDLLKRALPIGDSFQASSLRHSLAKAVRFNPLALSLAAAFIKQSGTATWDYIYAVKTVMKEHIPRRVHSKRDRNLMCEYATFYLTCNALSENSLACFILNLASYLNNKCIHVSFVERVLRHCDMFSTNSEFYAALDFLVSLSLIRICDVEITSPTNALISTSALEGSSHISAASKGKLIWIHTSVQEVNRVYQTEYSTNKLQPFHCVLDYLFKWSGFHQQRHVLCGVEWIHHFMHIFESKSVHSHFLLKCKENQEFLFDVFLSKGLTKDLLPILKKIENVCERGSRDRYLVKALIARSLRSIGQLGVALSEFEDVSNRVARRFGQHDVLALEAGFMAASLVYKQKRYAATLDMCNDLLAKVDFKMSALTYNASKDGDQEAGRPLDNEDSSNTAKKITINSTSIRNENKINIKPDDESHVIDNDNATNTVNVKSNDNMNICNNNNNNNNNSDATCSKSDLNRRRGSTKSTASSSSSISTLNVPSNENKQNILLEQCKQLRTRVEFLTLRCAGKSGSKSIQLSDLEDVEERVVEAFQENHPNVFRVQYTIGKHMLKVGDIPEAIAKLKTLETMQDRVLGPTHKDLLKTMGRLAECFCKLHDHQQSLPYFVAIKERCCVMYGPEHIETLKARISHTRCLQNLGRNDEAFEALSRIETIQQNNPLIYKPEDSLTTKLLMADHLEMLGYYKEALGKYSEVLDTQLVMYDSDPNHRDVLKTKHHLASCLHEMGRLEEAMFLYRETEREQASTLGDLHEDLIRTQHNLSVCLVDSCQEKKAFKELKEVEEKQKSVLTPHHPELLVTQTNLALCLHKRHYFERALKKYEDVLHMQRQHFGDRNPVVLSLKHHIAVCLHDQGNHTEAFPRYDEVCQTMSALLGSDHPDTLRARYNRAICYFDSKKYRKAMAELVAVEQLQAEVLGEHHADTQRTQTSLNVCERDASSILMSGPGSLCTVM